MFNEINPYYQAARKAKVKGLTKLKQLLHTPTGTMQKVSFEFEFKLDNKVYTVIYSWDVPLDIWDKPVGVYIDNGSGYWEQLNKPNYNYNQFQKDLENGNFTLEMLEDL